MRRRIFMQLPKANMHLYTSFRRSPRTPQEQEMMKCEIESTDGRIDRLVYELYVLSEDEISIVEGK